MKISSLGLDQLTIHAIRNAGYGIIDHQSEPDPGQVEDGLLILTSEQVAPEALAGVRERYPDARLLYWYREFGIGGYRTVHMLCEERDIQFLPPRTTPSALVERLRLMFDRQAEERANIIAVLGTGAGVGCTGAARLMAERMAAAGCRVLLLGMNVYDPGYDHKPSVSLDRLRPKLTGKRLHPTDFEQWVRQDGYLYLPGSFDYLSALDYQEDEMEYLLTEAAAQFDIVISDCGSIPESAAWYAALQKSSLRVMVASPRHEYRLHSLLELAGHLGLAPKDFRLWVNRCRPDDGLSAKTLAARTGCELLLELPEYASAGERLPLGRRELQLLDSKVKAMLCAYGLSGRGREKGVLA
ncbi:hypothetical protein [Paenibacillus glufosinatiresistens]|uniref:hypothetical protein n=1 Tax=Paenibacillus glufosinatiresistens TaxID=3070657 RepID=UPI00286E6DC7|nr:hypothetical protein [Paenibacillus sp. YX.27]